MFAGFLLHLSLALTWMFLAQGSLPEFCLGALGSYVLLLLFQKVLPVSTYLRRLHGFLRFILVFFRELALANITIARSVLFQPTEKMQPDFLIYPVPGLNGFEIFLLSQCISLTPGTTTVQVDLDRQELHLHAFDAAEPEELCRQIDRTLKEAILAFTR
ncbi:MAG: Na+/H+ antiporter subunit E [Blastochloris sp.]|nr:Na+/H+ antiporter subunit E [Blastochloris sp.]